MELAEAPKHRGCVITMPVGEFVLSLLALDLIAVAPSILVSAGAYPIVAGLAVGDRLPHRRIQVVKVSAAACRSGEPLFHAMMRCWHALQSQRGRTSWNRSALGKGVRQHWHRLQKPLQYVPSSFLGVDGYTAILEIARGRLLLLHAAEIREGWILSRFLRCSTVGKSLTEMSCKTRRDSCGQEHRGKIVADNIDIFEGHGCSRA